MSLAQIAPVAIGAGTALQFKGNLDSATAVKRSAARKQQAAEFAAAELRQNAGQQIAAGEMGAAEVRRQGDIANSDLVAKAAASGGGVDDPTIVNLQARNAGITDHLALLKMYEGEDAARTMNLRAAVAKYGADMNSADAQAAASAYQTKAAFSVASGASSLYSRFWTGLRDPDGAIP